MDTKKHKKHRQRGFTIIELMIASSISLVVTGMILSTYIQCMRGLNDSHQRMNLAHEMHSWTNELNGRASRSNLFALYKTANPDDIDELTDRQRLATDASSGAILSPGGDLAVFVFFDFPKPTDSSVHLIRRVDIYSLGNKDAQQIGKIEHIAIEFDGSALSASSLEDILTDSKYYASGKWSNYNAEGIVVNVRVHFPQVRGLAIPQNEDGEPITGTPTNRLFYMSADRNIMVMGQHYSGNKNRNSNDRRTHTNGFSFNITPRT